MRRLLIAVAWATGTVIIGAGSLFALIYLMFYLPPYIWGLVFGLGAFSFLVSIFYREGKK